VKIDIQYRLTRWLFGVIWFFLSLLLLPVPSGFAQKTESKESLQGGGIDCTLGEQVGTVERIMFYNVENAFWPDDDPLREDDDFTLEGDRHWSKTRLREKLYHLTRVILAAGEGKVPMLVGLAEVEGDSVMHFWTHHTPLRRTGMRYVVTDGPDVRGIQTALLYHPSSFRLLQHEAFDVAMPEGERPTRQILHATGRLVNQDSLDVLVCHLPSRLGGAKQTQEKRDAARTTLLHIADSIATARQSPHIIIMGDMNENPQQHILTSESSFVNLMYPLYQEMLRSPGASGTHKYQGQWSLIDHFIVHPALMQSHSSLIIPQAPVVFSLPFMLTDDITHQGQRPLRSYYGYRYEGGYSDHLPIIIDLHIVQ